VHQITDHNDDNPHVDYILWNPVKHGWVQRVVDWWLYLCFHQFVEQGFYTATWWYWGDFKMYAHEMTGTMRLLALVASYACRTL